MIDQYILYDTAVANWVTSNFSSTISSKPFNLMVGTPDRAFAQYLTPTGTAPDGRPPLPRVALTLGDPEPDLSRYNPNTIRKLGYADSDGISIRRAKYPVPIIKPYTVNFWTEYRREMNSYSQTLLKLFNGQYNVITVDVDSISPVPVYGRKQVVLYSDGGVSETGNLEPGNKERELRRTFSFHLNAWLWDLGEGDPPVMSSAYSLKDFEFDIYSDKDLTNLIETINIPKKYVIFTAVAGQTDYSGVLDPPTVVEKTLFVDFVVSAVSNRAFDNGNGDIVHNGVIIGSVHYAGGDLDLSFIVAPDDSTDISVGYFSRR